MRIYSSSILSWTQVLHVYNASRLYSGRWQNYYFYRIKDINPLRIITYSPLNLLQEDRQYFCYYKLHRDKRSETFGNVSELISNPNMFDETLVRIPKYTEPNDLLVIHDIRPAGYQSLHYPPYTTWPVLQ
jgi:hypothetical protein